MAAHEGQRAKRRRFAAVVGGVAATALCVSFAWSVVGGALRPPTPLTPSSIVIATSSQPVTPPPIQPRHRPGPPAGSVRFAVPSTTTAEKRAAPTGAARTAGSAASSTEITSTGSQPTVAGTLLESESNASRTRGQPAQE